MSEKSQSSQHRRGVGGSSQGLAQVGGQGLRLPVGRGPQLTVLGLRQSF